MTASGGGRRAGREAGFRFLAAGSWVSQFGNGVTGLTVLLALTDWYGAPGRAIAGYALAGVLPCIVFGVLAGAVADRFDRRRILVVADLLRAGLVASMVAVGPDRIWLLLLLTAGSTAVTTVSLPAAAALVPSLVGVDGVRRAQATLMIGANLSRVAGMGLAGVLVSAGSLRTGFLVDAGTFLVAAGLKARLPVLNPGRSGSREPSFGRLVVDGVRYLRRSRPFAAVLTVHAASAFAGAAIQVLYVPFTLLTLGAAPVWLAVLEGAGVVGLVSAGLWIRRRPSPAAGVMLAGLAATGSAVSLFGAAAHVAALVPLEFVYGAGLVILNCGAHAVMAWAVPEEMLGRAFGILGAVAQFCSAASLVVMGVLSGLLPARGILAATGLAVVACTGIAARLIGAPDRAGRPAGRRWSTSPEPGYASMQR